jgi:hypothetical protein
MALSSIKASTQDASAGTPVATATNEDDSTKALQATVPVGNKSSWSETARTGLTAADAPTGGDMTTTGFAGTSGANLFDCGNALSCSARATCDTASATLAGRLALYDGSNNCLGLSELLTFTSDATRRLGNATGDFVAQRYLADLGAARKARFFVEAVSAGTWAVKCQPV